MVHGRPSSQPIGTHALPQQDCPAPHANVRSQTLPLQRAVWQPVVTQFAAVQRMEWTRLIHYGLTLQSSSYGSFFYLIIGAHALHAVAALVLMMHVYHTFANGTLRVSRFWAAQVFWYFVVGLWPFLYVLVYLS